MAKGGTGRTSGNKSYLENYGTGKTSNKVPPVVNRENIHRNSNTQNYDYKVQDNIGSNGSSSGGSGFKKNNEPPVKDSGKTYTFDDINKPNFSIGLNIKDINFVKNPTLNNTKTNIEGAIYNSNINAYTLKGYNILNDYPASATKPTYKQSEKDLTEVLEKAYKNDSNIVIQEQVLYKGQNIANKNSSGSVRPDNAKFEKSVIVESYEMKNYKIKNYNNMAKTIVEQYEKRKKELPVGTRQNIIIDARGQGISYSQEQKIIQKIINKSNGQIKNSDITIWK